MKGLTGVLDANAIIGLAKGGVFDLLSSIYDRLYVPLAVRDEVIGRGGSLPGQAELARAIGVWIEVVVADPRIVRQFSPVLSATDREVLAVAQSQGVDHVLSADKQLIREANRHGLTCLRAADVVVLLKQRGLLPEAKATLDLMRQRGYGIADVAYEEALRAAGEWPPP